MPTIAIGGFTGAAMALALQALTPGFVPNAAPFVIVGIAGLITSMFGTPLAGIVMAMEITGYDINLLPAVIIAVPISYIISHYYLEATLE
jgi:H+/Cl- antiporter ClcA